MSGKNTTVQVVKINAQAENLAKALATLKKDFQGLVVPPELDKIITKLENSIAAVQRKTEKGIVPREVFLESEKEIGKIKIKDTGIKPGLGINKDLDEIGDVSIIGIVSDKENPKNSIYNETRLSLIKKISNVIVLGILEYFKQR